MQNCTFTFNVVNSAINFIHDKCKFTKNFKSFIYNEFTFIINKNFEIYCEFTFIMKKIHGTIENIEYKYMYSFVGENNYSIG